MDIRGCLTILPKHQRADRGNRGKPVNHCRHREGSGLPRSRRRRHRSCVQASINTAGMGKVLPGDMVRTLASNTPPHCSSRARAEP